MSTRIKQFGAIAAIAAAAVAAPAAAKDKAAPIEVTKCAASLGSIAVVDGDTQGWTKFGLGSPRQLIAALANDSGCFTIHSQASGTPATFLMNVIAGDKVEIDRGVEMAKGAAVEGLVRSGAANGLLRNVPVGGALIGMFGGLGGKKKTVAAGIRVISPASGMTLVTGSGEVRKSSLTFAGLGGGGWSAGAAAAGYASSGDGKMLTEAFIQAFNAVVGQGAALASAVPAPAAAAAPVAAMVTVAVDTRMLGTPAASADVLRSLRASTTVTPTGKREGLFVEVKDSFGTQGWVSVEDLR